MVANTRAQTRKRLFEKTGRVGRHDIGLLTVDGRPRPAIYLFSPGSDKGVSLNLDDWARAVRRHDVEYVLMVAPRANMRLTVSYETVNRLITSGSVYIGDGDDGEYAVFAKRDLVAEDFGDDDDEVL